MRAILSTLGLAGASCALLAPGARAQSLNVDIGTSATYPTPSSSFGAGAGQPGTWTSIPVAAGVPQSVVDLAGNACAVTFTVSGGVATFGNVNLGGSTPDDRALLADVHDPQSVARTWTIAGLLDGDYELFTYAMAPDDSNFRTQISVAGSADPAQVIGGFFSGNYAQGLTHALHHVSVVGGQPVVVTAQRTAPPPNPNFGSVNGFQLRRLDSIGHAFCFGDGLDPNVTTPCPCANAGSPGHGCASSANSNGALLSASGSPALDTVVLAGSDMPFSAACIYLQGDAFDDLVFGDGVRCAGGSLIRLRTKINSAGASSFPDSADTVTVSQRGAVIPGSGVTRLYQVYYRNAAPAFCPPATFNASNGWLLAW